MNLILIGLRGSGKTTVGRLVASLLKRPFVDLDDVTARAMGAATVADAWRLRGEGEFRAAEAMALVETLKAEHQVIGLGGGTPTTVSSATVLRAARAGGRAAIVYLAATAETLRARLKGTDLSSRPSLTGADPLSEIEVVLGQRDALYRALADHVVETDGLDVAKVAERVAGLLGTGMNGP